MAHPIGARWEREGVIYNPGIVSVVGQKYYKVKKIIVPNKTYLYETNKVESIDVDCMDDFIIAKSLI